METSILTERETLETMALTCIEPEYYYELHDTIQQATDIELIEIIEAFM